MRAFPNQALSENDELTAREVYNLLYQQWPSLQVSLPTIKRICQKLGWVCEEQSTWCNCMSGEVRISKRGATNIMFTGIMNAERLGMIFRSWFTAICERSFS